MAGSREVNKYPLMRAGRASILCPPLPSCCPCLLEVAYLRGMPGTSSDGSGPVSEGTLEHPQFGSVSSPVPEAVPCPSPTHQPHVRM